MLLHFCTCRSTTGNYIDPCQSLSYSQIKTNLTPWILPRLQLLSNAPALRRIPQSSPRQQHGATGLPAPPPQPPPGAEACHHPRRQPTSSAFSYTSDLSYAPAAENWTVAGLRQVLISADVIIPRRSTRPDLLALYTSLQSREPPNSSPPPNQQIKRARAAACPTHGPNQSSLP